MRRILWPLFAFFTIGLIGCDRLENRPPIPLPPWTGGTTTPHSHTIPEELESYLKKALDIQQLTYIAIVSDKDNLILLKGNNVEEKPLKFPIKVGEKDPSKGGVISNINNISIVEFTGSHCKAHVEGGSGRIYCYSD